MNTVDLEFLENLTGLKANKWNDRYYFNAEGMVDKMFFKDGKLHYKMCKGRNSTAANEMIEKAIGCNIVNRYREAAPYVVLV